jgi:hypothetical protein
MAEELGSDALYWYDAVYNIDSSYVHSDVTTSRDFLKMYDEGVQVNVGPIPFSATDIISKACEFTRIILLQACDNWELDKRSVFDTWEQANELLKKELDKS